MVYLAWIVDPATPSVEESVPSIAWDCGFSERQVKRAVAGLEEKGLISVQRGNGRGNRSKFSILPCS